MKYDKGIHGYWMEYSNKTYADLLQFEDTYEVPYILPNAEDVRDYELPDKQMVGAALPKSDAVRWQSKICQRIHVTLVVYIEDASQTSKEGF